MDTYQVLARLFFQNTYISPEATKTSDLAVKTKKEMFPQGVVLLMITNSMPSSSALSNLHGPSYMWRRAHISEKPSLRHVLDTQCDRSRPAVGVLPGKKQQKHSILPFRILIHSMTQNIDAFFGLALCQL